MAEADQPVVRPLTDLDASRFGGLAGRVSFVRVVRDLPLRGTKDELLVISKPGDATHGDLNWWDDNAKAWVTIATAGVAGNHNILSTTHPDTTPAAVTRGAVMLGVGVTPKWTAVVVGASATYLRSDGTDTAFAAIQVADLPALSVAKTFLFQFPDEDMAVGDFISQSAIRIPASGKHGDYTWGTIYVRCTVVGTGTNTILFRTSTTLAGARTTRATVALGTSREASAAITLAETDGMYLWVTCSAVGGTAPKWVMAQIDAEEAAH